MTDIVINKGLKKNTVTVYDDIEQLSIDRFNKANKYWMLHDNLGSSFEDIDRTHINRLIMVADNKEKILKEIENLRILIYNIINEVNPSHMAFACLVHSIDGKDISDYSESGLKSTLKILDSIGMSEGLLKKKWQVSGKKSMVT
jgi:hypothetical protein